MRKYFKYFAFLLACTMALTMTACERKTYTSLEEWYADNPSKKLSDTTFTAGSTKASAGVSIEGNVIVYQLNTGAKVFGKGEMTDAIMTAVFDSAFAENQSNNDKLIEQLSADSGIDASLISIRYEVYNRGETTPAYIMTYP